MIWQIGDYIVRGELFNTSHNTVHGWLDFGGDCGLRLEMVGNFEGELAGGHMRFEVPRLAKQEDVNAEDILDAMAFQQIGVVVSMGPRQGRVRSGTGEQLPAGTDSDKSSAVEQTPCLYLEWYGQDGQVVAEIMDPVIEWIAPEEDDSPNAASSEQLLGHSPVADGSDGVDFHVDEEGHVDELPFSATDDSLEEDPYQLFSPDIEQQLEASLDGSSFDSSSEQKEPRERSWDEVLPGIDAETKKLYEQWDEVLHGEKDEPVVNLFDPPLSLKPPARITDEAEARKWLTLLLARLAQLGIALDMCKHYTALDAYRLLIEEILPEAGIHPQTRSSGFVRHFCTWEYCDACAAEFEADYKRRHPDK